MWIKKGHLYSCDFYGTGYAQDAFIDILSDKVWRIYYSARTRDVISYPFYIDVEAGYPENILSAPDKPLMEPGRRGTFDDMGITMTSIVPIDKHRKYLYYCGWNRKKTVSYSLAIGCCEVVDDKEYRKVFDGPIMERSIYDPIAVSAPMVLKEDDEFRMWYISFTSWEKYCDNYEPIYVVKHSTSKDGITWECTDDVCIGSEYPGEAIGRPWVLKDDGVYKMWFSTRGIEDYRIKAGKHYMIGYAESLDGLHWIRKPEKFDLALSAEGWDSEMLAYASVKKSENKYYMIYNGNAFGKTGFGYAVEEQ